MQNSVVFRDHEKKFCKYSRFGIRNDKLMNCWKLPTKDIQSAKCCLKGTKIQIFRVIYLPKIGRKIFLLKFLPGTFMVSRNDPLSKMGNFIFFFFVFFDLGFSLIVNFLKPVWCKYVCVRDVDYRKMSVTMDNRLRKCFSWNRLKPPKMLNICREGHFKFPTQVNICEGFVKSQFLKYLEFSSSL